MSCFFGHKFGEWKIFKDGELIHFVEKRVIGHAIFQRRKCTKCGFEQLNTQKEYI